MDAVTPGLTLGTLYSSGVGTNKAKQHTRNPPRARTQPEAGRTSTQAQAQATGAGPDHSRLSNTQAQVLHLNHADPGPGRAGGRCLMFRGRFRFTTSVEVATQWSPHPT